MIDYIDCEERLSPEEHYYLYKYFLQLNGYIPYKEFHIYESFIDQYNNLPADKKEELVEKVNADSEYEGFINSFNQKPWDYEKPVIWSDRSHTEYFIGQLEKAHSFEVYIDYEFKKRGVNIGLYYGRDAQYAGETEIGIEIKYDAKSTETNNYYIEYQERMRRTGSWVNSGILKDDNSRFYLLGTINGYVIFKREDLIDYYNCLMAGEYIAGARLVRENAHNTSKGFILKPVAWRMIALSIDDVLGQL